MNGPIDRVVFAMGVLAALGAPGLAHALTPTQSAAVTAKAQSDSLAKLRAAALVRAQRQATMNARAAALERARTLLRVRFAVQSETQRRIIAATKAAEANAAILSAAQPRSLAALQTRENHPAMIKVGHSPNPFHAGLIRGPASRGAAHGSGAPAGASHPGASPHR